MNIYCKIQKFICLESIPKPSNSKFSFITTKKPNVSAPSIGNNVGMLISLKHVELNHLPMESLDFLLNNLKNVQHCIKLAFSRFGSQLLLQKYSNGYEICFQ